MYFSLLSFKHRPPFSLGLGVGSYIVKNPSFVHGAGGGGGLYSEYERGGDACRLAYGCKFLIWVSLRVFGQNGIILILAVKVLFRVAREKI